MSGFAYTGRVNKVVAGDNVGVDSTNPAMPVVSVVTGPADPGSYFEAHIDPTQYVLANGEPIDLGQWLPLPYNKLVKGMTGASLNSSGQIEIGAELDGKMAYVECVACNVDAPFDTAVNPLDDPVIGGATSIENNATVIACGYVSTSTTILATSGAFLLTTGDVISVKWRTAERDDTKRFRGIGGPLSFLRLRIVQ